MNIKVVSTALALTGTFLYLLCVAYGLTNPVGGHMQELLVITLPGFEWLTPTGFAIGLAKSFLYGALLGIVYVPTHNLVEKFFGNRT
ncbi:MAG TPA: DUF5676 family membrane protein [Burkholderiales bacterium]|nr:DUF5676 family membrane protein [Burkholderiales bacterium]